MSFSATVLHVLIASPSDVPDERIAIAQSLHDWNALNAQELGYVLLPVMWESHSAPAMGDRPQEIINEQLVRSCDMLIGAFWQRLGSPTGLEDSGTVEEINGFLKRKKPVMLYFSKRQVDLDTLDVAQITKLRDFKKTIRDQGLQESYVSADDLKQKLARQLTIMLRGTTVGAQVAPSVVREAKASAVAAKPTRLKVTRTSELSSTSDARATSSKSPPIRGLANAISNDEIWLTDYTEKAFVIHGDTTSKKDELKELGGKYISLKTGGRAWMFSKKRLTEIAEVCGIPPIYKDATL